MYPILFYLGGRPVSSWVVLAWVGIWVAFWIGSKELKKRIPRERFSSWELFLGYLFCLISWFVGAMIGNVLTVGGVLFEGMQGYVLYGGVIGVVLYGLLFWWIRGWYRFLFFRELIDVGALGMAWAFFFGRLGCFLYGCCYGKPFDFIEKGSFYYFLNRDRWDFLNQDFPEKLLRVPLYPAPLYEAFFFLMAALVLQKVLRQTRAIGSSGFAFWMSYALVRFSLEPFRGDERGAPFSLPGVGLSVSPSQGMAILTFFLCGIGLVWSLRKKHSLS